jgi:hypothetical protein
MAFKLIEAAQGRWRAVNGPHLVPLVRAGATFVNGQLVERPAETVAHSNYPSAGIDNFSGGWLSRH